MAGEIINRTGAYQQSVEELLTHINHVKTMLWVGDTDVARDSVSRIVVRYQEMIDQAMQFKKVLLARRNQARKQLMAEIRTEQGEAEGQKELSAKEISFIQREVALRTKLQTEKEITLFVTAPIASLAMRLYRMLFNETEIREPRKESTQLRLPIDEEAEGVMSVKEHKESGFRFLYISNDNGQSETRAYRTEPPPLTIPVLIRVFQVTLETSIDVIEKPGGHLSWPLWLRAFTAGALIDLTVFDPGRLMINLTTKTRVDGPQLVQAIFNAISIGQRVVREEYNQ
jgi:hypothetical protein